MTEDDRDTLPPPALAGQLAELRAALERVSEVMAEAMPLLHVLSQRLNVHELAILTTEHKANQSLDLAARVARLEQIVTAAE